MNLSDPTPFDIHGFDADLLDIEAILQGIDGWKLTQIPASSTIYRADPADAERFPSLAIKYHPDALREFSILQAFDDFGVHMAPRPFYADHQVLVTEWLHGKTLRHPPPADDKDMWHRIMALLGIPNNLPFAKYASTISMTGKAPQSPGDVIDTIRAQLTHIDTAHSLYDTLAKLVVRIQEQVEPTWQTPPHISLNHLDPWPRHFIWDGQHLRLVDWHQTDWADTAFAVGQLCAHPAYEEVSPSHWVWYRWEIARLTQNANLTAQATTYTNLLQAYWAIRLTADPNLVNDTKKRDRYLKRAQRTYTYA